MTVNEECCQAVELKFFNMLQLWLKSDNIWYFTWKCSCLFCLEL